MSEDTTQKQVMTTINALSGRQSLAAVAWRRDRAVAGPVQRPASQQQPAVLLPHPLTLNACMRNDSINRHNRLALVLAALALSLSVIQQAQAAAWTTNAPMITARYGHTVTLLPNGKLLAVGGYSTNFAYIASAELYDPATGTWAPAAGSSPALSFTTLPRGPGQRPAHWLPRAPITRRRCFQTGRCW